MSQRDRLRTGDQALVREINLSLMMNQLRKRAPISRAMLAQITGLNKTTVSSLVHELIEHQFVHEVGRDTSGTGRPAVLLALNPAAGYIVSCEIGVDFVSAICANFAAEIVWQRKISINQEMGQQAILERALALLRELVDKAQAYNGVLGLAVGVPGLVDHETGHLLFAPNLGWRDVPLEDILRQTFDLPIFVDNEANMAALGEHFFGAAQGYDEVLYISVGVGLGGAIVRQGLPIRGKTGFAGEFGHMTIIPDGLPCNCGNRGCWETLVSQAAVFRQIQQPIQQGRPSILTRMTGGDWSRLTIPMVVKAARAGDAVALEVLDEVGHYLGIGIASLINALNPELVVFGGILSLAADFLLPAVDVELHRRALSWSLDAVKVVLARHGSDACVMGGIATVYQSILAQPGSMSHKAG